MRYLCLIYEEEKNWATMSEAEGNAIMGEYFAFTEGVKKSGHYVAAKRCSRRNTATTVRVRQARCPRPTARSPRPRNSWAAST